MIKKAVVQAGLTPDVNNGKPGWFIKNGEAVHTVDARVQELPDVPIPELKKHTAHEYKGNSSRK